MSAAEREKYCVNFSMEEEEIFLFFYLWVHEGAGAYNRGLYRKVMEKKKKREMITEGVGTSLAPTQLFTQNWPDIDGFNIHELSSPIPTDQAASRSFFNRLEPHCKGAASNVDSSAAILHDVREISNVYKFPRSLFLTVGG